MPKIDFISHNPEQTIRLGLHLGKLLQDSHIVCLAGHLGAGKTALTRGIGAGWGAQEAITSPTFTLIHEHHRADDDRVLYHVDCYRLAGADDAWGIGLEDLLHGDGVVVIEWPEHIQAILPNERLWITLTLLNDTNRHIRLEAIGEDYSMLLEMLRRSVSG